MPDILTRRQQRAAQLRGRGFGMREIAAELGVSERTLMRWFKLPAVQAEQGRTREEAQAEGCVD